MKMQTRTITLTAVFTAIMILFSQIAVPIPFLPVPFTLSLAAVFLASALLEMKYAVLVQIIYIALGLAGLPVFSKFGSGLTALLGPTGGYIMAYPFMALLTGCILRLRQKPSFLLTFSAMLCGLAFCYLAGTLWLAFQLQKTFLQALMMGVIPFVIPDLIKAGLCALLAVRVRNRLRLSKAAA